MDGDECAIAALPRDLLRSILQLAVDRDESAAVRGSQLQEACKNWRTHLLEMPVGCAETELRCLLRQIGHEKAAINGAVRGLRCQGYGGVADVFGSLGLLKLEDVDGRDGSAPNVDTLVEAIRSFVEVRCSCGLQ